MKTSLIIDDQVFEEAEKEAHKTGKTISEIISNWAATGREIWNHRRRSAKDKRFKPLPLGAPMVDLSSRKNWMGVLDDDGT